MGGLGKGLVLGTEASKAACVSGEEARHAPGPVVDLKVSPIGLVGAGLSTVVSVVCSWNNGMRFIQMTTDHLLQAISQMGQVAEGTQRLLDPVSKMTLNCCPGVPSSIGP